MKRTFNLLRTFIPALAMVGCATLGTEQPTVATVPAGRTPEPNVAPSPTSTPENAVTAIPTPLRPGSGGVENTADFQTPRAQLDMANLSACVGMWSTTDPPQAFPAEPGSSESSLHPRFMPDIGKNDGSGRIVLEGNGNDPAWNGMVGTQPYDLWLSDEPCPAIEPGNPIQPGMDPFKMSTIVRPDSEPNRAGIPVDSTLALFWDRWVTVDTNGLVNGYVDITGYWQTVDKAMGIPKSTEEAPVNSFQTANPFVDPRIYKADIAFHNALVRQQMASYTGPKLTADGTVSADSDTAVFWPGAKINPISSTYFVNINNGVVQNVVTLNLPATDRTGSDFVLNVTLNPDNPVRADQPVSRATPNEILSLVPGTVEGRLSLFYCASQPTASILGDIYRNEFQDSIFGVTGTADGMMIKWIVEGATITSEDQLKTLVTMDWFAGQ